MKVQSQPESRAGLTIGGCPVDRSTNEIRRADGAVRVEPKVMDVLIALADRAGTVVSREALLSEVWPGVVVGEEALTQSIIKLRKALGDDPRAPSFIETIPKRGYRLIANVAGGDAAPKKRAPSGRRGAWPLGAAGLALVAVAAGMYVSGTWRPAPARARIEAGRSISEAPTLAVTPFEALGAGPEQGYLARGIRSDLVTEISRLSGLRIINASGVAAPGAEALSARYVVGGTVQRAGAKLRIDVRLTDTRTNELLWSQSYERPFGDVLAIQDEISRQLVERLPVTLGDAERRRLAKRYTHSAEAYDDFLRAKALLLVRRADANAQARAYYAKAIDLDPQFARAYAGLAMTYAMDFRYQRPDGSPAALDRAMELAETARQIDPGSAEVYWAIGFIHAQARRYDQAIEALEKAIELNRSYADAYALIGGIYTYVGQPGRSIPLLRTALRLNPEGGYLYFLLLGRAYLFENDLDQALINLRESLSRNPEDLETHIYLAAALVASGNPGAAEFEVDEIHARDAHFSMRSWLRSYPLESPDEIRTLLALTSKVRL